MNSSGPESDRDRTPSDGTLGLRKVLDLLPELWCTRAIRDALLSASHADLTSQWTRVRMYQTFDARVLSLDVVESIIRETAEEEARRARTVVEALGRVLKASATGDGVQVLRELLDEAETLTGEQRYFEATAILAIALKEARSGAPPTLEARINKAFAYGCWQLGRLEEARTHYEAAREIWHRIGDRSSEIIAVLGLGNVHTKQGRWRTAEKLYVEALGLCTPDDDLRIAQISNNLSQVIRRQGQIDEACEWQKRAEGFLDNLDAPQDHVVCLNNAGLLHLARGDLDEARQAFLDGLAIAASDQERSALLLNLAQAELESGNLDKAEGVAREAEEFGVLASATRLLVEIYTLLGVIFRRRGDDQAIGFFEKALELARDSPYRLERARSHLEYGRLRRRMGDGVEARAHFEEARIICEELSASAELEEIMDELARPVPQDQEVC